MSGETIRVITPSNVTLIVTNSVNDYSSEKRFPKGVQMGELKGRLELVTGIAPSAMQLELYDKTNVLVARFNDDNAILGSYPVDDGMRLHVIGKGVTTDEFGDLSKVEKATLSEEEYSKRNDTVRAYLMRNKLGKYSDLAEAETQKRIEEMEQEKEAALAKAITVGNRCEVCLPGLPAKRGLVQFVGQTHFKDGVWVGVQYDEPLGKNDGSVDGKVYFRCPPKYGAFVKPQAVVVGDFPEEDFGLDDEM